MGGLTSPTGIPLSTILRRKLIQYPLNLRFQRRQMLFERFPNDAFVDPEIIVHENIPHSRNLPPRHSRISLPKGGIDRANRFTDDHEVVDHPKLG